MRYIVQAIPTNLVFKGDSVTFGVGASVPANRWSSLVCTHYNTREQNLAVNGTTASQTSAAPTTITDIPQKRVSDKYLFITFGLNDCWRPLCTPITFLSGINDLITEALLKGWNYSNIILTSDVFLENATYFYVNYETIALAGLQTISTTLNIKFIDWYTYGKANINPLWFTADNVHLTDLGYLAKKNYIVSQLIY